MDTSHRALFFILFPGADQTITVLLHLDLSGASFDFRPPGQPFTTTIRLTHLASLNQA